MVHAAVYAHAEGILASDVLSLPEGSCNETAAEEIELTQNRNPELVNG